MQPVAAAKQHPHESQAERLVESVSRRDIRPSRSSRRGESTKKAVTRVVVTALYVSTIGLISQTNSLRAPIKVRRR